MKTRVVLLVALAMACCSVGSALEPGLPPAGVSCKADKLDRQDDHTMRLSGNWS